MPRRSHISIIKDRFLSIKSKAIGYDTLEITMTDGTQYFIFLHNVTLESKMLDLGKANIKLALKDIKDVRIIVQNS